MRRQISSHRIQIGLICSRSNLAYENSIQTRGSRVLLNICRQEMANLPTIRKAELPDAEGIKACVVAAYQHYILRMGQAPGPMLYDYSQVISRHQAFVVGEGGQIIGVLVLVSNEEMMLLDNVAVHPDRQGQGLGRQLMAFAEKEAAKQGYSSLELYTHESMTENIDLYESLGYVETDRRTERGYRRVYMRKDLT